MAFLGDPSPPPPCPAGQWEAGQGGLPSHGTLRRIDGRCARGWGGGAPSAFRKALVQLEVEGAEHNARKGAHKERPQGPGGRRGGGGHTEGEGLAGALLDRFRGAGLPVWLRPSQPPPPRMVKARMCVGGAG